MTTTEELSGLEKMAIRNIVTAVAFVHSSELELKRRSYEAALAALFEPSPSDEPPALALFVNKVANQVLGIN